MVLLVRLVLRELQEKLEKLVPKVQRVIVVDEVQKDIPVQSDNLDLRVKWEKKERKVRLDHGAPREEKVTAEDKEWLDRKVRTVPSAPQETKVLLAPREPKVKAAQKVTLAPPVYQVLQAHPASFLSFLRSFCLVALVLLLTLDPKLGEGKEQRRKVPKERVEPWKPIRN